MPPYNMTRQQMMYAVFGGSLVALAACLFFACFGKLLGKTSLLKQLLTFKYSPDFAIRMTVLAGIIFSSAFLKELYHEHYIRFWPFDTRSFQKQTDVGILLVSGLLVGFGAALSGGCTYGHGVTGIPRLNIWSIFAVGIFSTVAYYTNQWDLASRLPHENKFLVFNLPDNFTASTYIKFSLILPFIFFVLSKNKSLVGLSMFVLAFCIGIIAGMGMMVGGLSQRQSVLHLLKYDRQWDPTILVFFATTIVINFVIFTFIIRTKVKPVFGTDIDNPKGSPSFGLLLGAVCFGVGWGLVGLCPGPFFLLIPQKSLKIPIYWGLSCCAGIKMAELVTAMRIKMKNKKQALSAN